MRYAQVLRKTADPHIWSSFPHSYLSMSKKPPHSVIVLSEEPEDERSHLLPTTPGTSSAAGTSGFFGTFEGSSIEDRRSKAFALKGIQDVGSMANGKPRIHRGASILKLTGLVDDNDGQFEKFRKSEDELKALKNRGLRDFYTHQNDIIDGFAEVDEILNNTRILALSGELAPIVPQNPHASREEKHESLVNFVVNINFILNFFLLVSKVFIMLLSNSVSLMASTIDSAMDFFSTFIIFFTNRIIQKRDWKNTYNYPTGKKKLEPMGVVIFAVFMISSFAQVLVESVERLLSKDLQTSEIPLVGLIIMGITIVLKSAMWLWCRTIKSTSVEALTQDAENDIVFNFFSILFPYVGQLLGWKYLDALGGALLSVYIIVEWFEVLIGNVKRLSGRRASPIEHQRVAYLLTRFSPLIKHIQHLSVYHAGDRLIVEADVVLPNTTDLTVAHNVGESAQYAIEQLENVERAFIHVDVTVNDLSGHVAR